MIKKQLSTLKKIAKQPAFWLSVMTGILIIVYTLSVTQTIDFVPIDGDFQNYNPARRLLAGQIPYKDFSVYIGSGEMILNAFVLFFFGSTFAHSLLATRIISGFIMWIILTIIFKLLFNTTKAAICGSSILLILNYIQPIVLKSVFDMNFVSILTLATYPGNSARLFRGFVIFLEVAILTFIIKKIWNKNIKSLEKRVLYTTIAIGIISGGSVIWSNDYGIAGIIAISIVYAVIGIKIVIQELGNKLINLVLNIIAYIISIAVGFFLITMIVTRGHIFSYIKFTLGASSFQQWYYDRSPGNKIYSVFGIDYGMWVLLVLILALYYIYKIIRIQNKSLIRKYASLAFLCLSAFIADQMYHLLSGGMTREIAELLVLGHIVATLIYGFDKTIHLKYKELITVVLTLVTIAFIGQTGIGILYTDKSQLGKYVGKGMNGYLSENLADGILDGAKIIGDNKVFSTYATALEVYTNQFQPTGEDYIIHVLGNEQRKKYIKEFKTGNYRYATTINPEQYDWEYWTRNANWFFYRELYKDYDLVKENHYQNIWEKKKDGKSGYLDTTSHMVITKLSNGTTKLEIQCDDKTISGTADVMVKYDTNFEKSRLKTGLFKKVVYVNSVSQAQEHPKSLYYKFNFFLPGQTKESYIPIIIKDGYGQATLTAEPENKVYLTLQNAKLEGVLPDYNN